MSLGDVHCVSSVHFEHLKLVWQRILTTKLHLQLSLNASISGVLSFRLHVKMSGMLCNSFIRHFLSLKDMLNEFGTTCNGRKMIVA